MKHDHLKMAEDAESQSLGARWLPQSRLHLLWQCAAWRTDREIRSSQQNHTQLSRR